MNPANMIEHRCACCFLPAPDGAEVCSESCREIMRDFEDKKVVYPTGEAA